jgi:hypothetical protein
LRDLVERRLEINTVSYPLSTLQRLEKYVRKGFTISPKAILAIAHKVKETNLEDQTAEFYER